MKEMIGFITVLAGAKDRREGRQGGQDHSCTMLMIFPQHKQTKQNTRTFGQIGAIDCSYVHSEV